MLLPALRMGLLRAGALAAAGMAVPAANARAQQATPPEEALEFYEESREHYQHGRYREAAVDLERAITLDPSSPTLLYNLARVYELLSEIDRAVDAYRRYLRVLAPGNEAERSRAEAAITRLQGAREQANATAVSGSVLPATPSGPLLVYVPRPAVKRGVADGVFWAASSTGAALLITAAIVGLVALNREEAAAAFVVGRDGGLDDREALAAQADDLALTADLLLVAGGAAAVGAALLYALRVRTFEEPEMAAPRARVVAGATGASVTIGVAF